MSSLTCATRPLPPRSAWRGILTAFSTGILCRATAPYLRTATPAQALLVPSVAFLDDLERWVAVLFLDKLPREPGRFLTDVAFDRVLAAGPPEAQLKDD